MNLVPCTLLAVGLALMTTCAAQAGGFDDAAWQRDYAQLKKTMEQDYANLAWFASPEGGVNLPRLDRLTRRALAAARSDAEARRAIEGFVGAFHDGHFSLLPDLAPSSAPALTAVPERALDANDPVATCAALGYLPTARIAFSQPLESLPAFQLLADGMSTVYRAGLAITASGRRIGVIRIQNFTQRAFPASCVQGLQALKTQGATINARAVHDAADDRWHAGLAEQIATLKAAGMQALLIDVGNNSGGNDSGDLFPRLLTDKPVRSARLRMVASGAARDYADEQLHRLDEVLNTTTAEARAALTQAREFFVQAREAARQPCDMAWVWTQQRPWNGAGCNRLVDMGYAGGHVATLPRGAYGDQNIAYRLSMPSSADDLWAMWTGPLYVLTDGRTYSSAEMFSAVVQDNHLGKTVGTTTGGDGCGFMAGDRPKQLSHSHLRLRMPDCMRLRADGRDEVAGIAPDLPVLATEGEDARQRATRILETIAVDLKN